MADIPKVCVITRTRNRPALLKRAIESVLGQSMTDWQHVIVNDGGDVDKLEAVCSKYKKAYAGRLLILNETHKGMQQASNTAIEKTDSVYISIHDDDDAWHKDFLKRTTGFLNRKGVKSEYQGVISQTLRVLESEQEDGTFEEQRRDPYVPLNEISLFRVGYENPFPPIAFLYRRKVHETIGLFDPKWDMAADLDFNYRFLEKFNIGVVTKPLAYYHWRDEGSSGTNTNTVTAKSRKHGQYLNELKNHYLRKDSSAAEAMKGLGFQVAGFLVENQWMMVDVRNRTAKVVAHLEELKHFKDNNLVPQLNGLAEAIPALGEALAVLNKAQEALLKNQDRLLQAGAHRDSALGEVIERLAQLNTFCTEALQPKLEGLADSVTNIGEGLQNLHDEHKKADKEREAILAKSDAIQSSIGEMLETVSGSIENLSKGQSEILENQASQNEAGAARESSLARIESQLGEMGHFNTDSLWPKLDGFAEAIENLGGAMGQFDKDLLELKDAQTKEMEILGKAREEASADIREKQEAQASQLDAIQEEIVRLREQSRKQWQIGRFRIQWLSKGNDESPDDSQS